MWVSAETSGRGGAVVDEGVCILFMDDGGVHLIFFLWWDLLE
tara:strand:+ start:187 stop:312 length:126 start_codon:yes stop_codon:yes gene_type:complete